MAVHFRPAVKSEVKPLIGLYAESGCGKTYGALLLAKGFAEDMAGVAMIETESGRGEIFADDPIVGGYQVWPIRDDFSPKSYEAAILAAGKAGFKVLIIDSASHEWEGAGGVLSMAAKNQDEGKTGVLVWQMPKLLHQRQFMLRLLGTPVPVVIVCMRAKYPMQEVIEKGKKKWIRSETLEPKQADDILFEMLVHAWIDQQHNLHVTKCSKDELRQVFVEGQPITVETGQRLAEWSKGGKKPEPTSEDKEFLKQAVLEISSAKDMIALESWAKENSSQLKNSPYCEQIRQEYAQVRDRFNKEASA